jgi:hypothetical protein
MRSWRGRIWGAADLVSGVGIQENEGAQFGRPHSLVRVEVADYGMTLLLFDVTDTG